MFIHKKIIMLILVLSILIPLNSQSSAAETGNTKVITDMADREITVPDEINRIIAAGAGTLRQVIYIDGIEKIVGVEQQEKEENWFPSYSVAYPELKELPAIGPQHGGDAELIVSREPDIIFYRGDPGDANNLQQKTGIPVILIKLGDFYNNRNTLYDAWSLIGEVLNRKERADELIDYTENLIKTFNKNTENLKQEKKPRVFSGAISHRGGHGLASTKIPFPPFRFLNLKSNITEKNYEDVTSIIINREKLLSWNPEFIFVDCENLNLVKRDIKDHPEYSSIQAINNHDIYGILPYSIYNRNQVNILINTFFIGKTLFPDQFKGIKIEEKADEIFNKFLQRSIYHKLKEIYPAYEKIDPEEIQ
ncbi:MAG: ABC transporter substrate-binding protein [Bacillota bacterium]